MNHSLPRPLRLGTALASACAVLLGFVMLAAPAQAQMMGGAGSPPADMQELRLDLMTAQLDLSDTQRAELQSILDEQEQQQQSMMQQFQQRAQAAASDSAASEQLRTEMQSEMQSMQTQTESQIGEVLDADQMENYRTLYAQERNPNADPVDASLEQIDAQLGLNDTQRSELRPVLQQQIDQIEQLRQQMQQAGQDQQQRQQVMQEAQQMQQETQQQFQQILDAEQMQKFERIQQAQQQLQMAQQRMQQQQMQQMRQQMQQQQGGGQ